MPTAPEATLVDLVLGMPGAASRVLGMHGLLELGRLTPYALAQRTERLAISARDSSLDDRSSLAR
ncbi:hypothetical protein WME75_05835 [Sorangium sp. So ce1014]|uniref:hypothetical protein n=1 Tax=Sorangium sp. So ce1014 TaxID=3133326 RepID=UPI003F62A1F5